MNADIDQWRLVDEAGRRINAAMSHSASVTLASFVRRAIDQTAYGLDAERLSADMAAFDSGHSVAGENGPRLVGVCSAENIFWVERHRYLISLIAGLAFSLGRSQIGREERETAMSAFSLIGHAIRMQDRAA